MPRYMYIHYVSLLISTYELSMPLLISVKSDSSEQVEAGAAESSLRESKGELWVNQCT